MTPEEFRENAHKAVDWVADYLEEVEKYPVKSQVAPGEVYDSIPEKAPLATEEFELIMHDFNGKILPGITHWQHPNFHAYFPANSSYPSILGEILTAGLGTQCMVWETSPAAAELEERVMEWLKEALSLPNHWAGVIQDTASTATLAAIISAREASTSFSFNENGGTQKLRIYCSSETHSSIEKAVKIAGIGSQNLVKIAVDESLAMNPEFLAEAIDNDISNGLKPCCVIASVGTTGTLAIDPVGLIGEICKSRNIWLHVDAAYAGSAMILPELDWLRDGLEFADSFVFNPHKWLFTNFDCSAYYVKDKEHLIRTFEILPEYLKTPTRGKVNDYRDWGIPLGRRFRALKLWFVLRSFGVEGIRDKIREHIVLTQWFEQKILNSPRFELVLPRSLNVLIFRVIGETEHADNNALNKALLEKINASGKAYLSHTVMNEKYVLRLVIGQTNVKQEHVQRLWQLIEDLL